MTQEQIHFAYHEGQLHFLNLHDCHCAARTFEVTITPEEPVYPADPYARAAFWAGFYDERNDLREVLN